MRLHRVVEVGPPSTELYREKGFQADAFAGADLRDQCRPAVHDGDDVLDVMTEEKIASTLLRIRLDDAPSIRLHDGHLGRSGGIPRDWYRLRLDGTGGMRILVDLSGAASMAIEGLQGISV